MTKTMKPPPWAQAVERFATWMRVEEKGKLTIRKYTDNLNSFGTWYHEHRGESPDLARLTKSDLVDWKQELIAAGRADQTVNGKLSAIASFVTWAQREEGLTRSIGIPKKQRVEKQPPRWLTRNEKNALLRAVEDSENELHLHIVTILLNTGLRVSELAALKWSQIKQSERKGELNVEGKGRKKRTIELNVAARGAFSSLGYEKYRGQERNVILSQHGPMSVRGIQYVVEHYGPKAGLDHLTVHMLRHTFAHDLLNTKPPTPLHIVRDILGHESINTTASYTTPSKDERQTAVDRLSLESSDPDDDEPQPRPARRGRRA